MREQLDPSQQPIHRRAARGAYRRFLAASFRLGKGPRSALYNRFQPKADWPGHDARWESLEDFGQWLPRHVRWKADALNGAWDVYPDRGTIAAQFRDKGIFEDDCDGLAYFAAQSIPPLVDEPQHVYVVTMILDPYSYSKNALLYAAHVQCIFRHEGDWRVISNDTLYPEHFVSFAQAVQRNRYCAGHPALWVEIRDRNLNRLAADTDLERLQQTLRLPEATR